MNRGPLLNGGAALDSYRKDLSVVLSVTVLDVMMNHVDGGSAQRDIRTHLAPSAPEVCLWNFDDDTMSTRRCVASRNAAFTMSGGPYTHMSLMVERGQLDGRAPRRAAAAGSDDVQLLLGRRARRIRSRITAM